MELMPIRVKFRGKTPDLEIAPESFLRVEIDLGHGTTAWIERIESVWYINDEPAARVLLMGPDAIRILHPESGNTMLIAALERQRSEQERHEGSEPRECDACGDEVLTLSSDDLCDGCVEEGTRRCLNCGEWTPESEMHLWPNLKEPVTMCDSCMHDARRSGWEPGQ